MFLPSAVVNPDYQPRSKSYCLVSHHFPNSSKSAHSRERWPQCRANFKGRFQAIAINMIEFSSSLDPAQDMSGLQLNSSALLNRILICRSEDSSTSPIFLVSRTATKPCNTTVLKLTSQKTRFPEIEGFGAEVFPKFLRVR